MSCVPLTLEIFHLVCRCTIQNKQQQCVEAEINNLKVFQEFSPQFMVESYGKDHVEDGGSFHVPQLILWNGLHLEVQVPEDRTIRADKWNEARIKNQSSYLWVNHLLSIFLLFFLPDILLLEITHNPIQDLFFTTLQSADRGGKSVNRERLDNASRWQCLVAEPLLIKEAADKPAVGPPADPV